MTANFDSSSALADAVDKNSDSEQSHYST